MIFRFTVGMCMCLCDLLFVAATLYEKEERDERLLQVHGTFKH
jgi:hypothetical protein